MQGSAFEKSHTQTTFTDGLDQDKVAASLAERFVRRLAIEGRQ